MQSHETCPSKTATPVTCGDCRCGPPNPRGRSRGPSMGWFNYTRKTLCMCMCLCVCMYRHVLFPLLGLTVCVDHHGLFEPHVISFFHVSSNFQIVHWNIWMMETEECRWIQIEESCLCFGVCAVYLHDGRNGFSETGDPDVFRVGLNLDKTLSLYESCAPSVCSLYGLHSAKKLWK